MFFFQIKREVLRTLRDTRPESAHKYTNVQSKSTKIVLMREHNEWTDSIQGI